MRTRKIAFLLGALLLPMNMWAGGFSIATQYWNWQTNYEGAANEFYMPVSLCLDLTKNFSAYTQTELGAASVPGFNNFLNPAAANPSYTNLSGAMVGVKLDLDLGSVTPFANVGLNLPSGDLKLQKIQSSLPTDFVDSRYQGVTFGFSVLAGVELPAGDSQVTIQAGYMDPGVFNQTFDLPPGNTYFAALSDTYLASVIRSQTFPDGSAQNFGLWAMIHDPNTLFQLGPNFDLFYQWENPKGFSVEAGIQLFLTDQLRFSVNSLTPFPHNLRGPRFYADPSIALGAVALNFQVEYVAPNDYPVDDPNYDGGGWLLGLGPAWLIQLGKDSDLKLSALYNKIIQHDAALDANGNIVDVQTNIFVLEASFELGS